MLIYTASEFKQELADSNGKSADSSRKSDDSDPDLITVCQWSILNMSNIYWMIVGLTPILAGNPVGMTL